MEHKQTICQFLGIKLEGDNPFTITHNGKEVYREYHDGDWWKKEYDSQGNVIYHEDPDGFWSRGEYDSQGNQIYYENSEGYWRKCEYDSEGNEIYREDSEGYWEKHEYDLNGILIYQEDSYGCTLDERIKELTMDEIAEKFNIPVEQLKIKK